MPMPVRPSCLLGVADYFSKKNARLSISENADKPTTITSTYVLRTNSLRFVRFNRSPVLQKTILSARGQRSYSPLHHYIIKSIKYPRFNQKILSTISPALFYPQFTNYLFPFQTTNRVNHCPGIQYNRCRAHSTQYNNFNIASRIVSHPSSSLQNVCAGQINV